MLRKVNITSSIRGTDGRPLVYSLPSGVGGGVPSYTHHTYIDTHEAAAKLGKSTCDAFRKWASRRAGIKVVKDGGRWLVNASDLQAHLIKHEVDA